MEFFGRGGGFGGLGIGVGGCGCGDFGRGGFGNLEAADPDLAVGEGEAHDVIDKGFCFAGAFGHAEDVG